MVDPFGKGGLSFSFPRASFVESIMSKSFLAFAVFLFTLTAYADPPENYPFLSYDKAMAEAARTKRPVFVYFGRYGCGYCEKTNKEAFSDPVVRERFIEHYILTYVDSESGKRLRLPSGERITERELGTRFNAFVTPIFSFTDADGKEMLRLIGVQSKETLLKADEQVQQATSAEKG
jgi:thioredoxin-related protein